LNDKTLDEVVKKIKDCKFEFLDGVEENEDILKQLLNLKVKGKKKKIHRKRGSSRKVKQYSTYYERWDDDPKLCFGQMIFSIVRRLCEKCYGCLRKISDYKLFSQLYGWHGDHQLKYWKKVNKPSQLYTNIELLLIECIKCRLACAFCHENGNISNYETKLQYSCQLQYNFGDKHRTASDVLESREMRLFILELKARKAFWTGKYYYMSWKTFQCLVWKFFGIVLADVSHNTEEDYYDKEAKLCRKRKIINDAIMNIIKKLGAKCPECGDKFGGYNPVRLSGVHMDHTSGIKNFNPTYLRKLDIDKMIKELKEGDYSPTCCFCHGLLN
jgi:hypothetical protein